MWSIENFIKKLFKVNISPVDIELGKVNEEFEKNNNSLFLNLKEIIIHRLF